MTGATKVCRLHWAGYVRGGRAEPVPIWARRQLPHIGRHQFILLNLPERLRWEVLYAVQQRAGRGGRVDAGNTKAVVRIMEAHPSLATMSKAEVERIAHGHNVNVRVHLHQFARVLRNAYDTSLGRSAKDALVWDLDDVGFEPQPNGRRPRPRRRKCLDFGLITQPWLRDLALAWAREESQSYLIVKTHRAAVVASQALESRSDRGQDICALGNRDVDAIATGVRLLTRADNGAPCQTSFKRHIFAVFFDLINWGRRRGLLDGLPASFEPTRTRLHLPADPVVEKNGKAIPEGVQRQLDAQTGLARTRIHPRGAYARADASDVLDRLYRPARHRAAHPRSRQPANALPNPRRRRAGADLRQPQGAPPRSTAPDTAVHRRRRSTTG